MVRQEIKNILKQATGEEAKVEYPASEEHGDYFTNAAMVAGINPKDLLAKINNVWVSNTQTLFEKVEVKNGFINFFLAKEYLQKQVEEILQQSEKFGNLQVGKGKKAQVEFISANPTGPLTLGNGRGGFCGDVLANVLAKAGYKIEREYYINDRGEQVNKLGHSVLGDEQAVYKGDYIIKLKKRLWKEFRSFHSGRSFAPSTSEKVGEKAAKEILEKMLKPTVKKMGIKFDNWFSEKSLYDSGEVDKVLKWLKKKGLAYEKDGALWFKSTDKRFKDIGDDKDRVLVKADGEKTYLASDAAYIKNKFSRGFDKLIYFLGADHYGYVKRMQTMVEALGYKKEQTVFIVMQLVKLLRGGKEVRMAKREGVYVTLDELIDEVGLDVSRWFFLTRSPNTHLNFDMDLAKEQSEKNPVYYTQYAHARICSIFQQAKNVLMLCDRSKMKPDKSGTIFCDRRKLSQNLKLLRHPSELKLIKQLIKLPEVIEDIADDYQVQRLPKYATDLATDFHKFYTDCRVLLASNRTEGSGPGDEQNKELTKARLGLVKATQIVLKNTLDLMGITAPEKM